MAMTRLRLLVTCGLLITLSSCDDTFNPVEKFEPAMIIYGVLNPSSDTQYVRVSSSYDPPDHNPANHTADSALAGVTVEIVDSIGIISFQSTSIPRWSNDRYSTPIPAFVAPGFRPTRGGTYTLQVSSPLGFSTATVTVPTVSYVFTPDDVVLRAPQSYASNKDISFYSILSPLSSAYFMRLFVDYETSIPGGWEAHTIEIPRTLLRDDSLSTYIGTYPYLRRRTAQVASGSTQREAFFAGPYLKIIRLLRQEYTVIGSIRFLRARAILYQTDEAFYRYVKTVNGFNDQFTIRTDEPDVTNLTSGRGLFSAVTTDTATVTLPSSLGL